MAVTTGDGCRLWTEVSGAGPALVLCHGGPGLWDMFGGLADGLSDRHTVWRWDQRGCGRSAPSDGPYTLRQAMADVDAVVDAAGGSAAVLGHSWGAQLALAYALAHPDKVRRLVYIAGTGLSPTDWKAEHRANSLRLLAPVASRLRELDDAKNERAASILRWRVDVRDPAARDRIAEAMATPWFPVNWTANEGIGADVWTHWDEKAVEQACRDLRVPTLIMDGAEDPRPRWAIDSLEAALPDVQRVVLKDVGHLPWLEAPEPAGKALRDFLEAGR